MIDDPIVREVRTAREKLFKSSGYDLKKFVAKLMQEQETHPEKLIRLSQGTRKRSSRQRSKAAAQ